MRAGARWRRASADHVAGHGLGHRLHPVARPQLAHDLAQVVLHRQRTDAQLLADLRGLDLGSLQDTRGDGTLLLELSRTCPNITYTEAPKKTPFQFWLSLCRVLRFWVDYVRYQEPEFTAAPKLTERSRGSESVRRPTMS